MSYRSFLVPCQMGLQRFVTPALGYRQWRGQLLLEFHLLQYHGSGERPGDALRFFCSTGGHG